jgi:hypothetical protein
MLFDKIASADEELLITRGSPRSTTTAVNEMAGR